jgi:hypothetical protein
MNKQQTFLGALGLGFISVIFLWRDPEALKSYHAKWPISLE